MDTPKLEITRLRPFRTAVCPEFVPKKNLAAQGGERPGAQLALEPAAVSVRQVQAADLGKRKAVRQ